MIEIQINSYREFLQLDVAPTKRKNIGLQAVFTEVFPIESYDGKVVLDFHSYEIGEPKQTWLESLPAQGMLWEYRTISFEIAWWRNLDPVRLKMIVESETGQ